MTAPRLNECETLLLSPRTATRDELAPVEHWLSRVGEPGEQLSSLLARKGYLTPHAARILEVCWRNSVALPGEDALFTRAGARWLEELLPPLSGVARGAGGSARHGGAVRLGAADPQVLSDDDLGTGSCGRPVTVGHYRVLETLGGGLTGTVSAAESVFGGPRVALKLIAAHDRDRQRAAESLLGAAGVVNQLRSPGVVPVLASGWDGNRAYVVMPLREQSLRDLRLRRALSPDAATAVCARVARTLAAVHDAGVAHGNMKLSNILLGPGGVEVSDFCAPSNGDGTAAESLRRADILALQGIYATLLGWESLPAVCHEIGRTDVRSMAALAAALESVLVALPRERALPRDAGANPRRSSSVGPVHSRPALAG